MSTLQNAPLVEVIFELRWSVSSKEELAKCQYLHGDLYAELKNRFSYRQSLVPPEIPIDVYINNPAYRFRVGKDDYPLVQVGPGVLTVNTIDEKYVWNDFQQEITSVIEKLLKVYSFTDSDLINPVLQYIDFLQFDFEKNDISTFLKNNLHIELKQDFFNNNTTQTNLNLSFFYQITWGSLSINFNKGNNKEKQSGILIRTSLTGNKLPPDINKITAWLKNSHDFCSQLFKDMTKGSLYDSF
jgi:uncharacterized protein (TIGR04255 family)